ncbi:MAG: response regulator [Deltaproteobacteria bacterium]|nr:response regulator [Deltaproteobacteria bacterium]
MSRAFRHGLRLLGFVGLGIALYYGVRSRQRRIPKRPDAPLPGPAVVAAGPMVLVVEDDPDLGAALYDVIAADGFSVRLAVNGADAIEALDDIETPCALLVDLLMPGIVGQEFLEYVRSDDRLSKIPVAIVSASPELAPPGYPVFQKPLDVRAILQFVRGHRPEPVRDERWRHVGWGAPRGRRPEPS